MCVCVCACVWGECVVCSSIVLVWECAPVKAQAQVLVSWNFWALVVLPTLISSFEMNHE